MRKFFSKIVNAGDIYAHCDVPCGVYTTHQAGIAAETVEKMVQKIVELERPAKNAEASAWQIYNNSMVRFITTKEEWAQICKNELSILWSDYFKEEHLEIFSDLHTIFWKALKLCSANKREVSLEHAKELREAVDEIAKMFKKAEGEHAQEHRKEWL